MQESRGPALLAFDTELTASYFQHFRRSSSADRYRGSSSYVYPCSAVLYYSSDSGFHMDPSCTTGHSLTFHIFDCALPPAAHDGIGSFHQALCGRSKRTISEPFRNGLIFLSQFIHSPFFLGRVDDTLSQFGRYRSDTSLAGRQQPPHFCCLIAGMRVLCMSWAGATT